MTPGGPAGRRWAGTQRPPGGLRGGGGCVGRAALPELQCWLGATWLSSLYKAFLFLGRFSIPHLFITAAWLSSSGACPREGLLKAAEFSNYHGHHEAAPTPNSGKIKRTLSPHPPQTGPGKGPSLLARLSVSSYPAAEFSPGTYKAIPRDFLAFPWQVSYPGG